MRKIVLAAFGVLALAGAVAVTLPAVAAYNCTTTCSGYGNTRTCNTSCF